MIRVQEWVTQDTSVPQTPLTRSPSVHIPAGDASQPVVAKGRTRIACRTNVEAFAQHVFAEAHLSALLNAKRLYPPECQPLAEKQ